MTVDDLLALLSAFAPDADGDCDDDGDTDVNDLLILIGYGGPVMLRTTTFTVAMMACQCSLPMSNMRRRLLIEGVPASADGFAEPSPAWRVALPAMRKSVVHQRRQVIAPTSSKPSATADGMAFLRWTRGVSSHSRSFP